MATKVPGGVDLNGLGRRLGSGKGPRAYQAAVQGPLGHAPAAVPRQPGRSVWGQPILLSGVSAPATGASNLICRRNQTPRGAGGRWEGE